MRKTRFDLIATAVYLFIFAFISQLAFAQPAESTFQELEEFEQFVESQMAVDRIPGLSIGFYHDDFTWTKGFGFADLENDVPAKPQSAYRLASVTKPMTAVAVMQLVEAGKIDLDAEVQTYVPYFPEKEWPVTIRQLLGHLGGISHYRNYDLEGHFKEHHNTREAIAVFEDFELVAEPGTRYQYTSYGYNLLGAVIEGASGQSYGDYMTEHVWLPLDMTATRLDDPVDLIPNRVSGYRLIDGEIKNSEFVDISSRFAAGGTRSTVIDMLNFARGVNEDKILARESLDLMFSPMERQGGRFTGYGMGWSVSPVNGRFCVRHSGGQPETRTLLVLFPEAEAAIAVACNFEGASRDPYVERLYRVMFDAPWEIEVYFGDKNSKAIYRGLERGFDHGLAYFSRYGRPVNAETESLAAAFAYLNTHLDPDSLRANFDDSIEKIEAGIHPVGGQALTKVGSFIAQRLQADGGSSELEKYHLLGAIPFFHDYIRSYENEPSFSDELKLAPEIASMIAAWNDDWRATWNPVTQNLQFESHIDLEVLSTVLKQNLPSTRRVLPDYTENLQQLFFSNVAAGHLDRGHRASELAVDLYPRSSAAKVMHGMAVLFQGDADQAFDIIGQAAELDPAGDASAGQLNRNAYYLASLGKAEQGLALLMVAVKLHPEVANLYDSIGEFHLNKGETDAAIEWYQKALEVDPDFDNPKRVLEQIRQRDTDS